MKTVMWVSSGSERIIDSPVMIYRNLLRISSATRSGAIAASGLQELAAITGEENWKHHAGKLADGLLEHCADWGENRCGILTHCTASYHDDGAGRHTNIVYGDYFLVEALMKLCGRDPELWS